MNEPITLAPTNQGRYESRSNKLAKLPISQRWMTVLSYHLAGKSADQISNLTGYSVGTVRVILANPKVNEMRQLLLQSTQEEFEALFDKITNKIREMLDEKDSVVDAIKLWIQMHGRGNNNNKQTTTTTINNVTAEDIVFNILNNPERQNRQSSTSAPLPLEEGFNVRVK